jgi:hypothetical protein
MSLTYANGQGLLSNSRQLYESLSRLVVLTFVDNVKSELGFKAVHRQVTEVTGAYTLREQSEAYAGGFGSEIAAPENTISRDEHHLFSRVV